MDQLVSLNNRVEGRSFFHLDALRSTVNLTDGGGSARQSVLYDAWGNERDRVGASANKFTYTGHEKDEETGLIYAKARFYDPEIGRFLSQDSLFGSPELTPTLNRYSYVGNRPTVMVDPLGLYGEDVHRGLTYFLARRGAGFGRADAKDMAEWSQYVDDDPFTAPVEKGLKIELRKQFGDKVIFWDKRPRSELESELSEWHLPKVEGEKFVRRNSPAARAKVERAIDLVKAARVAGDSSVSEIALRDFGRGLHPYQDSFSHEEGEFAHPFRGSPGDRDYSTPLRSNTDWTHTTPGKSEEMAQKVLQKMLAFRRARGDENVPAFEEAWASVSKEVNHFIAADTREEKEKILSRWGAEPGPSGEWHISLPHKKKPRKQQNIWERMKSAWNQIKHEATEPVRRYAAEPLRTYAEERIRDRIGKELATDSIRSFIEDAKQREDGAKQKYLVVPELPEGK